ncbi:uncharacterized protein N0V89_007287 [Didymosphaeria variabile]|uniref:F-box domain-containing protein n=1 Tax=Didymosphaeria variabile TaxID=1932322 RepID=A0A9W9CAC1_9PLEO|nr:uncharacterized protein N0V89_007287 [Didymosphaeria variabile]KAJ4351942.1 hypothetical protein N0V89_007287 [Didymosphaeria variabile]
MVSEAKRHRFFNNVPGLKRRNGNHTRGRQSLRLDDLPDDILILVLAQCHVDDIFALRLTCSIFRDVFSTYSAHIIPAVARCTFPRSGLLLDPQTAPVGYTLTWLKDRIPMQLAAILVDRYRIIYEEELVGFRLGIPAEDALGSELRTRVGTGWRILRRLSNIAKEVYYLDAKEILSLLQKKTSWLLAHTSRYETEIVRLREELILRRRLEYAGSMSIREAQDYVITFTLLSGAWRVSKSDDPSTKHHPTWPFDFGHGIDAPRTIRKGESWVTWFILHLGPQLFWEQWWLLPAEAPGTMNHVRECAIEAFFAPLGPKDYAPNRGDGFVDPHEDLHNMQRQCAEKVQRVFYEKSGGRAQTMHMMYFRKYFQQRGPPNRAPAMEETMGSVPFFINFSAYECADDATPSVD